MKQKLLLQTALVAVLLLSVLSNANAQIALTQHVSLFFASVEEGKAILTAQDEFTERLSEFDRSARMKTSLLVSDAQLREFVATQVLEWTAAERNIISSIVAPLRLRLDSMALPFPSKIYIVKTTGQEEGDAAYTRGKSIILPQSMIGEDPDALRAIICHELFHVMTRNAPSLRDRLYETIGYFPCGEVVLPPSMRKRAITNPDEPVVKHAIQVKLNGKPIWGAPVLFSTSETYDSKREGNFFNYMVFKLLVVQVDPKSPSRIARYNVSAPQLVDVTDVTGFYEQIGKNTGYVIHPEEILADNFAMLVDRREGLPSPEVLVRMNNVLSAK